MAVLQQRSDGFCETQDGDFAVFMLRGIKNDDENSEFTYSPDFTSPRIKVTWQGDVGYFDQEIARALIAKGFARQITPDELKVVNGENDEHAKLDDNAGDETETGNQAETELSNHATDETGGDVQKTSKPPKGKTETK